MSQVDKAQSFKKMHQKGAPLVLYNIWDAGSAKTIVDAGATAVATGSWSVAAAQGYKDGQGIPLDFVLQIAARIALTVDVPVSIDFEGAYADTPSDVRKNVTQIIEAGAIGINFEDQVVGGQGLHSISDQAARIKAARDAAEDTGIPLFINARTDLFLKAPKDAAHSELLDDAFERASAYSDAGADGFFVPGLTDLGLIQKVTDQVNLPVNVMMLGPLSSPKAAAECGVSRVSYGPQPFSKAMKDLSNRFQGLS
ncbi:MAG: isocitrate lyase/phosphoenolpyruvate mutase family protein [Paracoccaceae bacterium]